MSNRTVGGQTNEYSICLDTVNRNAVLYPDTNDLVLNLDAARLRRGTVQMYVGSVELPAPQFTIEETWKNMCFDEGIRIVGNLAGRAISVRASTGIVYTALIPLYLNPVSSIVVDSPTQLTVTTMLPHALQGLCNIWGTLPITLIDVSMPDPNQLVLNSTNPGFTITGPSTFTLTVTSTAQITLGNVGFVSAPALASPSALCVVLNAALLAIGFTEGTFSYNALSSVFVLQTVFYQGMPTTNCGGGPGPVPQPPPGVCLLPLVTVPGEINLSQCMGFQSTLGLCASTPSVAGGQYCIVAENGPFWRGSIAITPGFYSPGDLSGLGSDINTQFNRFSLDSADAILFSNAVGTSLTVPVLAGRYTVDTLAAMLQLAMNTIDPQSALNLGIPSANTYSVQWELLPEQDNGCGSITGQFVFSCNGIFGLEFGDLAILGSSMPQRLGFNGIAYRNGLSYHSVRPLVVPLLGCNATYFSSRVVQIVANNGRRGFRIDPTAPRVVSGTVTLVNIAGIAVTSTTAHGFQEDDVLSLSFPWSPLFQVRARVSSVVTSTSYLLDPIDGLGFGAWPWAGGNAITAALFCLSSTLNVYFNTLETRRQLNTIFPQILGFDYVDLQAPAPFVSITTAALEPPPYLLLQVLDVKGSVYTQHNYLGDNLTNILAKVIFFPTYQMQRMYPMSLTFNGSEILTQLHFRWLTPDHQLYQFHGRNWSATMEFVVLGEVPVLMCG